MVRRVSYRQEFAEAVGDFIDFETTDWFPICPAHLSRLWEPGMHTLGKQATEMRGKGRLGDDGTRRKKSPVFLLTLPT